jgi:YbbR domain-containing protein
MRFNLRQNLYLKIFSFLLAVACWFAVSGEDDAIRDFTVPLEYVNLPPGLELSGRVIDSASVRLRAPEAVMRSVNEDRLAARIDMARTPLGEQHVPLLPEMINVPAGVDVVRVSPELIPIRVEKQMRKEVPVVAEFSGRPPKGYQVGPHAIEPPVVTIEGPVSEVSRVTRATTGTIILGEETQGYAVDVRPVPDAPPGNRVRVVAPSGPVRVRVTIAPAETGRAAPRAGPARRASGRGPR